MEIPTQLDDLNLFSTLLTLSLSLSLSLSFSPPEECSVWCLGCWEPLCLMIGWRVGLACVGSKSGDVVDSVELRTTFEVQWINSDIRNQFITNQLCSDERLSNLAWKIFGLFSLGCVVIPLSFLLLVAHCGLLILVWVNAMKSIFE